MMRLLNGYKWFLLLLVVFALGVTGCAATPPPPEVQLLGEWVGMHEGEPVTMIFRDDGVLVVVAYEEEIPAPYAVDFSFTPAHLDLLLDDLPLETIIELVDANTLRFENNFPGEPRPAAFSDTAETVTLTRK